MLKVTAMNRSEKQKEGGIKSTTVRHYTEAIYAAKTFAFPEGSSGKGTLYTLLSSESHCTFA